MTRNILRSSTSIEVIPIASHVDARGRRHVQRVRPQPGQLGQRFGQQRVLQRLGDAALLGVHLAVLRRHAVEDPGELLGALTAPRQTLGHQRGRERDEQADDRDDPRQVLEEGSSERPPRGDHEREHRRAEGNRRPMTGAR